MPGRGIQHLPFGRIPNNWDPAWFANFIKEVLALADARNSIGEGLDISGNPDQVATFSVNADILDLLEQPFVLAQPSGFLEHERTLAGEDGVVQILDGGDDANITVALIDGGINLGKLRALSDMGVLGNPTNAAGSVQNIQAAANGEVFTRQADELGFTSTPVWTGTHNWLDDIAATWGTGNDLSISHSGSAGTIANGTGNLEITSAGGLTVNGETLAEIAQDAVGTILTDSATIDFTYDDALNTITADVDESADFTWTGEHIFTLLTTFIDDVDISGDNLELALGAGRDLILVHDGTNSYIRNDTGYLGINMAGTLAGIIDTSGRLVWGGATAAVAVGGADPHDIQILRAGGSVGFDVARFSANVSAPVLAVGKSRGATVGSFTAVQSGDGLGVFNFAGADGTDLSTTAVAIRGEVDGAVSTDVVPGRLRFQTMTTGGVLTEALRITSAQFVQMLRDNAEFQIGAGSDLRLYHDGTNSFIRNDTGVLNINEGATTIGRFDTDSTAGNTRFMVYDVDNGTLERVSVGAADSGGLGFKLLRIPN